MQIEGMKFTLLMIAVALGAAAVIVPLLNAPFYPELTGYSIRIGVAATFLIAVPLLVHTGIQQRRLVQAGRDLREKSIELQAAKEEAEAASQAKTRFLAILSHEIRTPLNGIMGTAQLLARANLSDKQQVLVDALLDSGEVLLTQMNDLLEMSRVEMSNLELAPVESDIAREFNRVIRLYQPLALDKGLELRLTLGPGVPRIAVFDPQRLMQCIGNLVSNAIKFTHQGYVHVDVQFQDGQMLEIEIRDSGIGIDMESQALIFEAFSQANIEIERRYGGSGLGLAICKMLVEKMGGFISVHSSLGEGSCFRLVCPVGQVASDPDEVQTDALPEGGRLTGRTVLIVDDVEVNRVVLRLFLEREGALVVEATDGVRALEALQGTHPDLILIDGHMTYLNGPDVVAEIRRNGMRMPAILTSPSPDDFRQISLPDTGFNGIIAKPFSQRALMSEVLRVMPARIAA